MSLILLNFCTKIRFIVIPQTASYSHYNHATAQKTNNDALWMWCLNIFGNLVNGTTNNITTSASNCKTLQNENFINSKNNFIIYPNPCFDFISVISSINTI